MIKKIISTSLLIVACMPALALGAETTRFHVAFKPYHLGGEATITSSFDVGTTDGSLPAPITKFALRFPASLNFSTSNLGLATCKPAALEVYGVEGCPRNSKIGGGQGEVKVPIGPDIVTEDTELVALMGPPQGEQIGVLLYANGETPVSAQVLFRGELVEGSKNFGELLETSVPLIPSVPGAGYASVTKTRISIDPSGLMYEKRMRGKKRSYYHPRGFELPKKCPVGGFHFSLTVEFGDGSATSATETIPCPTSRSGHHGHHRVKR
jgi:hypothetical protein